ncbi:MAG: TerC family protein [Chloroflexota bacterium]
MGVELIAAIGSIILIDLVLSGDNAVVIGMAAHRLPLEQRRQAILIGSGAAIVLRVALTAIAAYLLTVPYLQLGGGLLLLWIAIKLLRIEEEAIDAATSNAGFRDAIQTIVVADLVMSTDNILGVAAAAHGDFVLLLFGLALSMAIMLFGGTAIAGMIDRFWWLAYLGSAVIAWTGAEMILADPVVHSALHLSRPAEFAVSAVTTIVVTGLAHFRYRHRKVQPAAEITH